MKKALSVFAIIVLLVQLSGCGIFDHTTRDEELIDEMSEKIIRCLVEKDCDALEDLFCQQVKDAEEIETQIGSLFEFFDCDYLVRYDLDGNNAEAAHSEYGDRVEWSVSAEIVCIEVGCEDTTRYYGVEYDWTQTYQKDNSLVGLHSIRVYLLNDDESRTVGTDKYFPF